MSAAGTTRLVEIPAVEAVLEGELVLPESALGVIRFAHGSGCISSTR